MYPDSAWTQTKVGNSKVMHLFECCNYILEYSHCVKCAKLKSLCESHQLTIVGY